VEKRMNGNREHMEKKMEELKKSMYDVFLNTRDEIFPKVDRNMD